MSLWHMQRYMDGLKILADAADTERKRIERNHSTVVEKKGGAHHGS
jgi:hypothetical protein